MLLPPHLRAFQDRLQAAFQGQASPVASHVTASEAAEQAPFPSTALPGAAERRLAWAVVLVSTLIFFVAVPFAKTPLTPVWAFIPIYEAALAINDLVTAVLLLAQFMILRSRRLLILGCAYLFTSATVVVHALTFPGLFSPTGLLGAGPQSTAWLYMFWHGGFPLLVIAYAFAKDPPARALPSLQSARRDLLVGVLAVFVSVGLLTLLATAGQDLLPAIMVGNRHSTAMIFVVGTVWLLSVAALIALWTRTRHTMIDVWLMVVMCAWLFDIALGAVLNGGRFDLGFYAGRIYGMMAATFVLLVLLVGTANLYGRLANLLDVEQQQRRRESLLRQRIFDTSLDLLMVCDQRGKLLQVSPSSQAILGYPPEEMTDKPAAGFVHADDLEATRREMYAAHESGVMRNFDCRYMHRSGRAVPLVWSGSWSERDGRYFFSGRDMTEHQKLEQQLRQAQKMEAVGQLTGGIAHDFNNILSVIIGMTELTAASVAHDPQLSDLVKEIDQAAERGAQLVKRMLAFARKQPLEARVLDVNEAVGHVASMLKRTLGEDITLKTVLGDKLWPAVIDPSQLEEAILNLAVNARDAMPKGGKLCIETANAVLDEDYAAQNLGVKAGEYLSVTVTDSGTGMSPEIIERVFEPFFTTKEVGKGTGLGLSMVYGFVKQSGGHVKIYSEVGHGTSFRLYFPKSEQSEVAEQQAVPANATLPSGRETILVVEDDPAVRQVAVTALASLGYDIKQAPDGKAALNLLRGDAHIDLLFTDMVMPNGVSGQDLARTARELRPGIKILLTSGYSEEFIALRDDIDQHIPLLSKPYRRDKLASAVRAALNGSTPIAA